MRKLRRNLTKNTILLLVTIAIVAVFSTVSYFMLRGGGRTIEQAFLSHTAVTNRRMGDIIFIDDQSDNLTVFHPNGVWSVSHYVRETRWNGNWYTCVGVSSGGFIHININEDSNYISIQQDIHSVLADNDFAIGSALYDRLGRRPLHGTSYNPIVNSLSINGEQVHHVLETTDARGNRLFFWYFSDFPLITGEPEDIIVSFEYEE